MADVFDLKRWQAIIADDRNSENAQKVAVGESDPVLPILGENVTYIVAGVALRHNKNGVLQRSEDFEVLLVQESKLDCYEKWYLPAGRMDPGESIEESLQREVLEESGLVCAVKQLVTVQVRGGRWFRFTFLIDIIGGTLKTPDKMDKESIQAQWFSISALRKGRIILRAHDIYPLITSGTDAYLKRLLSNDDQSSTCQFTSRPQLLATPSVNLQLRFVILSCDYQRIFLLHVDEHSLSLLKVVISPYAFSLLHIAGGEFLGLKDNSLTILGVVEARCLCKPVALNDGLSLTVACTVDEAGEQVLTNRSDVRPFDLAEEMKRLLHQLFKNAARLELS